MKARHAPPPGGEAPTENGAGGRRPGRRLVLMLYPFAAAAVAVNVFMLGLIGPSLGLPSLSPNASLLLGALLGIPAAQWSARRLRALIDEAEGR